jgi:DNA-binding transcriptional regulator YdaS (Cro superfamily)
MKLKEYLKKERSRALFVAKTTGCGASTISMIMSDLRRPSPVLALRIERATGGAVSRDELLFPELYAVPTPSDGAKVER